MAITLLALLLVGCTRSETARDPLRPVRSVAFADLTVDVPSDWPLVEPESCDDAPGPTIVIGRFDAVQSCAWAGEDESSTRVVLGTEGPADSPVASANEREFVVNGVAVQEFSSPDGQGRSELFARFPDHHAWLRVMAPGGDVRAALVGAHRILRSVRVSSASSSRPTTGPLPTSFIGHWYVHGGTLDIMSPQAGQTGDPHGCDNDCLALYGLRLDSRRPGRLRATVTRVDYVGGAGKPVRPPNTSRTLQPGDVYRLGDWFELEFVEPELLMTVASHSSVPSEDPAAGYRNPYWCGEHLAEAFGRVACGL